MQQEVRAVLCMQCLTVWVCAQLVSRLCLIRSSCMSAGLVPYLAWAHFGGLIEHVCSQAIKDSICEYLHFMHPYLNICCSLHVSNCNALHWQPALQQARVSTGVPSHLEASFVRRNASAYGHVAVSLASSEKALRRQSSRPTRHDLCVHVSRAEQGWVLQGRICARHDSALLVPPAFADVCVVALSCANRHMNAAFETNMQLQRVIITQFGSAPMAS